MSLYILDKNQTLIRSIPNKNIFSLVQEEEINKADILRGEIKPEEWQGLKDEAYYMAVNDPYIKSDIHMYKITSHNELLNRVDITGVNFAYDELKAYRFIEELVGPGWTAIDVLTAVVAGTDWQVGAIDTDFPTMDLDLHFVSRLDALKELIERTGGEIRFRSELSGGEVTARRIDFVKELSEFKGQRFALGSKLLDVTKEEDTSELYTALIGTGANVKVDEEDPDSEEEILTFKDVVWSKAAGDPVDKPKGQNYVEIPEATELYGYADGSPRMGRVEFSSEDMAENVLIQTYNELITTSRPKMQFSAVVDTIGTDMELGETVAIVKPGTDFRYFTRVFKVRRDYLNNYHTEVEFGDRLSQTTAERLQTIKKEMKEEIKDEVSKSTGGGGGVSGMREVKGVPVSHTMFHHHYENPSDEIDAYVDGFIQEFRHSRRPEFSHPLNPNVPDGEYIEDAHEPPSWAPKPDYGGYGTEGPKVIKYLYANDGRIYISWNDMERYYLTSEFMDVFQVVHGYYPRQKTGMCLDGYTLVTDDDFRPMEDDDFIFEEVDGDTVYIGDTKCVEIPEKINGVEVTSINHMFTAFDSFHPEYHSRKHIVFGVKSENNLITDMGGAFRGINFEDLDDHVGRTLTLYEFNSSKVTNMSESFRGVSNCRVTLNALDTSSVTDMSGMFRGANIRDFDISNFDTSSVEDMSYMFNNCFMIKLDLSNFNTSNVTNMSRMFHFALRGTVIDLSSFDTSNVVNMSGMFDQSVEQVDLTNFDTSNVMNMRDMFYLSPMEVIDLSSFALHPEVDLRDMFYGTSATVGYARTQEEADRFNDASVTGIPDHLTFVVKGGE